MKLMSIILPLLLLCGSGWACGSYQECVNKATKDGVGGWDSEQSQLLLAIAFKLDEISRKLKKPEVYTFHTDGKVPVQTEEAK